MDETITCKACGKPFETWYELARHIISKRDNTHRRHRLWATKYLQRNVLNKRTIERRGSPMTNEDKLIREDTRRELSSATEQVITICPRCNHGQRQYMETEYTENNRAWRIKGRMVKLCVSCGGLQ